jgi:hypothetical protein
MLADLLGYDKYAEVTTEFAIRGTYVDLAVKVDGQVRFLVEVKPVGAELRDAHVKQAIDYGASQGVEWIADQWREMASLPRTLLAADRQISRLRFGRPTGDRSEPATA